MPAVLECHCAFTYSKLTQVLTAFDVGEGAACCNHQDDEHSDSQEFHRIYECVFEASFKCDFEFYIFTEGMRRGSSKHPQTPLY